ncbi:MAG: TIGR01244 family sulfur transferase [Hyphomonadaceae bacterium]
MADIRPVTLDFAVAPQLQAADFTEVAAAGFKTVINNRPERESPGQLSDADARAAAAAAGLDYVAIPFAGMPSPAQVEATRKALAEVKAPVLAYCRSGTRSITVWALSQAGVRPVEQIVDLARAAGYDLSGLAGALRG